MRILNLGSLNFDKVYDVPHFVGAGETILASNYSEFLGGKGLNQSLALGRAGADITHAGAVGPDGQPLIDALSENNVHTALIQKVDTVSGNALIQCVNGQNCIIVYPGANHCITEEYIDRVVSEFSAGDILLLQNEISCGDYAITRAKEQGMYVAFNASPITPSLFEFPLDLVDCFLINEVEGKALVQTDTDDYEVVLDLLQAKYPNAAVVLTLGGEGVYYKDAQQTIHYPAYKVPVVDTTAAGDTFTGFFLMAIARDIPKWEALRLATAAGALAVTQKGAANSIPVLEDVLRFIEENAE